MPGDAFDGRRQAAIALGDEVGELVDLPGRFGRGLDLDPAADAIEDRRGIEGIDFGDLSAAPDTPSVPEAQLGH
jgi:hypothetical protein